jgi:hypothetical protein
MVGEASCAYSAQSSPFAKRFGCISAATARTRKAKKLVGGRSESANLERHWFGPMSLGSKVTVCAVPVDADRADRDRQQPIRQTRTRPTSMYHAIVAIRRRATVTKI